MTLLTDKLVKKKVTLKDQVEKVMDRDFRNVSETSTLAELGRLL